MPVQLILGGNDILIRSGETRERMERLVGHVLAKTCSFGKVTAAEDF